VLVVDDSALVRSILARGLCRDAELEVIGTAADPYEARDLIVRQRPDVMTLHIEMPKMDGLSFLRILMEKMPVPTVIVSSLGERGSRIALRALQQGAVDVVAKPQLAIADGLGVMMTELVARVKAAARSRVVARPPSVAGVDGRDAASSGLSITTDMVIALGASTGGVAALTRILPAFPTSAPGVVIVQHMPAGFTADFARCLDEVCAMRVAEARDGDRVLVGHVLVAPGGDRHLEVHRVGGEYRVALRAGPRVSGHAPSVDVFFRSVAQHVGANAAACVLTGMGADGAEGLLAVRRAGGHTFAQDRETSAVWGMPAAALESGAVDLCVPLAEIPAQLVAAAARRCRSRPWSRRPNVSCATTSRRLQSTESRPKACSSSAIRRPRSWPPSTPGRPTSS
jgi:two-component system chemotaxis response regulator CheB